MVDRQNGMADRVEHKRGSVEWQTDWNGRQSRKAHRQSRMADRQSGMADRVE